MNPPPGIEAVNGFLSDRDIRECLNQGTLLEKGTWDESGIRHASYTLRIGEEVRIARAVDSAHSESKQFTIHQLIKGASITLNPGDTAMLFSMEGLRIPEWIVGFTVARGLLFTEALAPENTYVDPGFTGRLYTTVTNVSNRAVTLDYGMPIARLFFYKLSHAAEKGYSSGSALGIAQQLKSVRSVAFGTPDLCRAAGLVTLIEAVRQTPVSGMHLAELCQRSRNRYVQLFTFALVWPVLLIVVNSSKTIADWTNGPVISNTVAGVLTAIIVTIAPKVFNVLKRK